MIVEGAPAVGIGSIHRLDKADTRDGIGGRSVDGGPWSAPYAMLLYERFLGRALCGPPATRLSQHGGDVIETAIEGLLVSAGIQFRKTKRGRESSGFDQAPDFIIPDEFSPQGGYRSEAHGGRWNGARTKSPVCSICGS